MSYGIRNHVLSDLLTRPLPNDQTAPPGVIVVEKLSVQLLGENDLAFRLFAFSASVSALVVFWWLAEQILLPLGRVIAVALFAFAPSIIDYAAQAKQYSSDVAFAVLSTSAGVWLLSRPESRRRAWFTCLAGICAAFFSQPAVFVLGAVSLVMLVHERRQGPIPRTIFFVCGVWWVACSVSAVFALSRMTDPLHDYLLRFWVAGFPPVPLSAASLVWPVRCLTRLFGLGGTASLAYPGARLYVGLAVLGGWSLWGRKRSAAGMILGPVLLTLLAAVAHQYPFSDRLILFLVPGLLLAAAEGIDCLTSRAMRWFGRPSLLLAAALTAPALYPVASSPPPYRVEDLKPVLAHLQSQRRAGDKVYVHYGGEFAFRYYAEDYNLEPTDYSIGGCYRGDNRQYLREVDGFRGAPRLWLVFSHEIDPYHERQDILGYLDMIGIQRDAVVSSARATRRLSPTDEVGSAKLYLYDLTPTATSSVILPANYPLNNPSLDPRFLCY